MKRVMFKQPLHFRWEDSLLDLVSCLLLSAAFNNICLCFFGLEPKIQMIFCPLITLIFLTVTTLRAWWLPALLAAVALIGIPTLWFSGMLGSVFAYISELIQWLSSGFSENAAFATNFNLAVFESIVEIVIAVLAFLCVCTVKRIYPIIIAFFVLTAMFAFWGVKADYILAVILVMLGVMPVAARNSYQKNTLLSILENRRVDLLSKNWHVQITAGLISIVCLTASVFIVPENTHEWRIRPFTNLAADLQSVTGLYTDAQRKDRAPTPHKIGIQPRHRLGGDINLTDETLVAVIEGNSPVLLKTTALEYYDGTMWSSDFLKKYRVDSNAFSAKKAQVFGSIVSDAVIQGLLADKIVTRKFSVMIAQPTKTLPTAGRIVAFTEDSPTKDPILFNTRGELFCNAELPEGFCYQMESEFYDFTLDGIYKLAEYLSRLPKDQLLSDEEFIERYTSLPDNYSSQLSGFANSYTEAFSTDLQKVVALVEYFSDENRFTYTDQPGALPKDTELSLHLMNSSKGNSVYYATAVALMARSLGIPSRMVVGYKATTYDEAYQSIVALEKDAYAWVECYISNLGWISFDPSPHANRIEDEAADSDNYQPVSPDNSVSPEDTPASEDSDAEKKAINMTFTLAILLLVFLILICLTVRGCLASGFYEPERVRKRFGDPAKRMEFYYRDLLRQLKMLGFGVQIGDTTDEIAERLAGHPVEHPTREMLNLITEFHYADGMIPSEEQLAQLAEAHKIVEQYLRKTVDPVRYWIYRRVFLPRRLKDT